MKLIKNDEYKELKEQFDATELIDHCECLDTALGYFDGDSGEDFVDWYIETYVDHCEVIYYSVALEYLKENDPSLRDSMALANECGHGVDSISSETLATLLLQNIMLDALHGLTDAINEYFDSIDE